MSITVTSFVLSAHSAHTARVRPFSNAHRGHGRALGVECRFDSVPISRVSSTSALDTNLQSMRHDACSENSTDFLRKRARKLVSPASRVSFSRFAAKLTKPTITRNSPPTAHIPKPVFRGVGLPLPSLFFPKFLPIPRLYPPPPLPRPAAPRPPAPGIRGGAIASEEHPGGGRQDCFEMMSRFFFLVSFANKFYGRYGTDRTYRSDTYAHSSAHTRSRCGFVVCCDFTDHDFGSDAGVCLCVSRALAR